MATGAIRADVTKNDRWIIGEDKTLYWDTVDSAGAPVDVSSYSMVFELKLSRKHSGTLFSIADTDAAMTVSNGAGTNDRVTVTVADTDLEGVVSEGWYWFHLRRDDPGNEGVMAEGQVFLHERGLPSS